MKNWQLFGILTAIYSAPHMTSWLACGCAIVAFISAIIYAFIETDE